MRLGKRGAEKITLLLLGELVFVAAVGFALLYYVGNLASDSLFEQNYMARDVASILRMQRLVM
jgi:hypothetical protein